MGTIRCGSASQVRYRCYLTMFSELGIILDLNKKYYVFIPVTISYHTIYSDTI